MLALHILVFRGRAPYHDFERNQANILSRAELCRSYAVARDGIDAMGRLAAVGRHPAPAGDAPSGSFPTSPSCPAGTVGLAGWRWPCWRSLSSPRPSRTPASSTSFARTCRPGRRALRHFGGSPMNRQNDASSILKPPPAPVAGWEICPFLWAAAAALNLG
jgi:hypothetical protein